jgi:hypothetical protein
MKEESNLEIETWASMSPIPTTTSTSEQYNITTSNTFETLLDNGTNPESTENTKPQKPNLEQNEKPPTQSTTQHIPNHKTDDNPPNQNPNFINAETVIICDSNGRYLKPELLCPNIYDAQLYQKRKKS